ncbi:MAG: hypothetical protein PCFJNLEI_00382 [Verrucomicrobiae bacterium]|nr:hypothetical protein [Verrucomicrobiae bacterium]
MECLVVRPVMQLHVNVRARAQRQDRAIDIAEGGPVDMREAHGCGHRRPLTGPRGDMERAAAHFGSLLKEREAEADILFAPLL